MAEHRITKVKKLYDEDGYWFTTKSGKHIFVSNNKTFKDYKDEKKAEIESYRQKAKQQITDVRLGKEEMKRLSEAENDYNYEVDKDGKLVHDKEGNLKVQYGPKSKGYYDESQKVKYNWYGPNTNEKFVKERDKALDLQLSYTNNRGVNTSSQAQFRKNLEKGQIKNSKIEEIMYNANAGAGGNWKTEDERISRLKKVENDLDITFAKNPIKEISDEEIEKDLTKTSNLRTQAQFGGLDYLAREKDAIRRAKTGDILLDDSNPYNKFTTYDQVVRAGNKVIEENPDHWNGYQDFATAIARQDKEDPIGTRRRFGNTRVIMSDFNDDYLATVSNEEGFNRYRTWSSGGRRKGFYDSYPDVYIDKGYVNKKDGTRSRYQRNADDEPSKTLTAEVNWGSIGSMDPERATHEMNKIKSAVDFAKKVNNVETKYLPSERRKLNTYSDMVSYYLNQGMSKKAAQRMAKWYMNNRKNK